MRRLPPNQALTSQNHELFRLLAYLLTSSCLPLAPRLQAFVQRPKPSVRPDRRTAQVDTMLGDLLQRLLDTSGATAVEVAERILLRPSHAIGEASDYLSRSGRTGEVDRDSDTMLGGGWVDITYYEHAQYHSVACEVKPTYSFA